MFCLYSLLGILWCHVLYLNLFEFIFVYDVREWSNFIDSEVAVQLSQHHLLKSLSFLCCLFLPPLCGLVDYRCVGSFLCYYVPLICISVFVPIPWLLWLCGIVWMKAWRVMPSALFFFLRIVLTIWGLLWFHINFRIICPSSEHLPLLNFPVESWNSSVKFISQVTISASLDRRHCWGSAGG